MQTIDQKNLNIFENDAAHWWSDKGPFSVLHHLNPIRTRYILNHTLSHLKRSNLEGVRFLDVGCGGGIFSESLARLDASVVGIDASAGAIHVAQNRVEKSKLDISYHCSSIEDFEKQSFDVVCALEIIEHVQNPDFFVEHIASHVKPGGLVFLSTLNRTWHSYLSAIVGAEYMMRLIPKGTHDWKRFIKPYELRLIAQKAGLQMVDMKGLFYNPLTKNVKLTSHMNVNYMACFTRED